MTLKKDGAARTISLMAICTAIMLLLQVIMAGLPNIEIVSLLIIVYSQVFKRKVLFIVYTFALLEGLIFGFHLWWISYLYVWTVLACITWLFRAVNSPLGWAVISGAFGLFFGALCSIPYFFIGGAPMALASWVSGIPFDLIHCAGNFVLCLLLWNPIHTLLAKTVK